MRNAGAGFDPISIAPSPERRKLLRKALAALRKDRSRGGRALSPRAGHKAAAVDDDRLSGDE